jgi:hypothetical protein
MPNAEFGLHSSNCLNCRAGDTLIPGKVQLAGFPSDIVAAIARPTMCRHLWIVLIGCLTSSEKEKL